MPLGKVRVTEQVKRRARGVVLAMNDGVPGWKLPIGETSPGYEPIDRRPLAEDYSCSHEVDFTVMPPSNELDIFDVAMMKIARSEYASALETVLEGERPRSAIEVDHILGRAVTFVRLGLARGTKAIKFANEGDRVAYHNRRDRLGGTLTERQWSWLREAFDGRCAYCGAMTPSPVLEHVKPICRGGRTSIDNVLPACWSCNKEKFTSRLEEWRRPDTFWWPEFLERVVDAAKKYNQLSRRPKKRRLAA